MIREKERKSKKKKKKKKKKKNQVELTKVHTLNAKVSAKIRLGHIDVLDFDLHVISLTIGLLSPDEFTARVQKRRRIIRHELCISH